MKAITVRHKTWPLSVIGMAGKKVRLTYFTLITEQKRKQFVRKGIFASPELGNVTLPKG